MKRLQFAFACVLVLTMLVSPVSASAYSPSAERTGVTLVTTPDETGREIAGTITEEDGTETKTVYEDELIVTTLDDAYNEEIEMDEEIRKDLLEAEKELKETKSEDLIDGFAEKWEEITEGAPVENAVVSHLFDIRYKDGGDVLGEGNEIAITVHIDDITAEDLFVIVYKDPVTEEWTYADYTIDENGDITIILDCLVPLAVIRDSREAPPVSPDDPDSPQTGVNEVLLPALAVSAAGLFALILLKKFYGRTAA